VLLLIQEIKQPFAPIPFFKAQGFGDLYGHCTLIFKLVPHFAIIRMQAQSMADAATLLQAIGDLVGAIQQQTTTQVAAAQVAQANNP